MDGDAWGLGGAEDRVGRSAGDASNGQTCDDLLVPGGGDESAGADGGGGAIAVGDCDDRHFDLCCSDGVSVCRSANCLVDDVYSGEQHDGGGGGEDVRDGC